MRRVFTASLVLCAIASVGLVRAEDEELEAPDWTDDDEDGEEQVEYPGGRKPGEPPATEWPTSSPVEVLAGGPREPEYAEEYAAAEEEDEEKPTFGEVMPVIRGPRQVDGGGGRAARPKNLAPREPFRVLRYDPALHAHREPIDKAEKRLALEEDLEDAFVAARDSGFGPRVPEDGDEDEDETPEHFHIRQMNARKQIRAGGGIETYVFKVLNPSNQTLAEDERDFIVATVEQLREAEGLLDDDKLVYDGFITRGNPKDRVERARARLVAMRAARCAAGGCPVNATSPFEREESE